MYSDELIILMCCALYTNTKKKKESMSTIDNTNTVNIDDIETEVSSENVTIEEIVSDNNEDIVDVTETIEEVSENEETDIEPETYIHEDVIDIEEAVSEELQDIDTYNTIHFNRKSVKNTGTSTISLEERKARIRNYKSKKEEMDEILDILDVNDIDTNNNIDTDTNDKKNNKPIHFHFDDITLIADTGIEDLDKKLNSQLNSAIKRSNRRYEEEFPLSEYARVIRQNKK